jgi:hypothetical protein
VTSDHLEILDGRFGSKTIHELFGYQDEWALPAAIDREAIGQIMSGL